VTADPAVVAAAERVVFPGQGAMPDCMRELDARGLRAAVLQAAKDKPFLGICVGEQMLFQHSDEGNVPALGVFPGNVVRFPDDKMGCRRRAPEGAAHGLEHRAPECRMPVERHCRWRPLLFRAQLLCEPADPALVTGTCDYGVPFTCAVGRDNIFAVQFHPEKSARDGLQLLKNFVEWHPDSLSSNLFS
jgi:glutamine amidotransferase